MSGNMTNAQQQAHGDDCLAEYREGVPMSERNRLRNYRPRRLRTLLPRILLGTFVAIWLAAFIPAAGMLLRYEWTAGAVAEAPKALLHLTGFGTAAPSPADGAKAALLIVAIHPRCTCTRATLEELDHSVSSWTQPVHAIFLIDQPARHAVAAADQQPSFDWHQSATLREAQSALHAEVVDDEDGQQAARLGALTSGEVLLYSAPYERGERRLLFSGGVTAGRGMAGENGGLEALEEAVQRSAAEPSAQPSVHSSVQIARNIQISAQPEQIVRHSPVYGCALAALATGPAQRQTR